MNVGMSAFAATVVLVLVGAGDDSVGLKAMPWGPIIMVSGVTVLVSLLERFISSLEDHAARVERERTDVSG